MYDDVLRDTTMKKRYHVRIRALAAVLCVALIFLPGERIQAEDGDGPAQQRRSVLTQMEELYAQIGILGKMPDSTAKTLLINQKDREIVGLGGVNFAGKKIVCLGDSITAGAGGETDESGRLIGYCDYLAAILGCEVVNQGIGGTTVGSYFIENSFVERYDQIPEDADIIILEGGLNDYQVFAQGLYTEFGDIHRREAGTYCGDAYILYAGIKEKYPNADVFVVTSNRSYLETLYHEVEPHSLEEFMRVQRLYAERMGFHVIDLYASGFLSCRDEASRELWMMDIVHPNADGHVLLAERVASELMFFYSRRQAPRTGTGRTRAYQ